MTKSEAAQLAARRGLPPGAARYHGERPSWPVTGSVTLYGPAGVDKRDVALPQAEGAPFELEVPEQGVAWLDVVGLHDPEFLQRVAARFGVHPVTLEDVFNDTTPTKIEDFGSHLYVSVYMITPTGTAGTLTLEHVSILMGERWLVTVQQRPGDVFDSVRERIRHGKGRIRGRGSDYLLHAILDAIVDAWFVVIQAFDEAVLELESEALSDPGEAALRRVSHLKHQLARLRRIAWPLQSVAAELIRIESNLIDARTDPFVRDLQDHIRQATEIVDGARDRLGAAMELHLALASHRMNEVMRVLTIVATLFIPLTFLAGIYGMNFEAMPELQTPYGYPVLLGVMFVTALTMIVWFRRRGWL